ncbi:galactose oxidase-like domain-containing protein [Deinococcus apachensis]|uniref:galactose oxidase-like domain-containing protein n=1 Tax=Deinococcus apachensis TaxID=309886 RepID=UPI001B7FA17D|nr:galactose oxidase-like domain-containing protein [Deinococcus apachensis]
MPGYSTSVDTNWPLIAINTAVMPDGNVITWGGNEQTAYYSTRKGKYQPVDVWDPVANTHKSYPFPMLTTGSAISIFCSGMTFDADGRLMVVGGDRPPDGGVTMGMGSNTLNIFDAKSRQWRSGAPMANGRWYPSATTLATGEILAVAGENDMGFGNPNRIPEVYRADGTWHQLTGINRETPGYPWLFVVPDPEGKDPNGRVFFAGPTTTLGYIDTSGATGGSWQDLRERDEILRQYGTAVMYNQGKILVMGGGGVDIGSPEYPTNTAVVIDLAKLNAGAPDAVRATEPMHYARRQLNATLLPDGKVLVTGGTQAQGASEANGCLSNGVCGDLQVYAAEVWDPSTEHWTELASMTKPRLYHSTAVLLPDGRVLSAGGGAGANTADQQNAEIFSPPYLFQTTVKRPVIAKVPAQVRYGQRFTLNTSDAASIDQVTWIRLSSTTHAFNMNQRINFLPFTRGSGSLSITAPARAVDAPPGHYMLFILSRGVPSVARIVQVK